MPMTRHTSFHNKNFQKIKFLNQKIDLSFETKAGSSGSSKLYNLVNELPLKLPNIKPDYFRSKDLDDGKTSVTP